MHNFEEPILPPEGDGHGHRYESADLDVDELYAYLKDTSFESEEDLADLMKERGVFERKSVSAIEMGMTRIISREDLQHGTMGKPLSGKDPQAVMRTNIKTLDGKDLDLRIFKVFNRNDKYRLEYILGPNSHE
ncbi:MAG: hypothetical protein V4465_00425 [Patescibacteria group bacterium]